ncbi:(d)CMP kinase [soil metagenome]
MTTSEIAPLANVPERFTVAIDGPAAAGKSTVADLVAQALDAVVFDTGILYRAVTLLAVEAGIEPDNETTLASIAASIDVDVRPPSMPDGRKLDVYLRGRDVTWELRSPEVDRLLSTIAALPKVRMALLEPQRRIGRSGRVVVVGRDIGTVVLPDADLKIFLMASPNERARRRHEEMISAGKEQPFDAVVKALTRRDKIDSERALSPLTPAADAFLIDSYGTPASEVARRIVAEFEKTHEAGSTSDD